LEKKHASSFAVSLYVRAVADTKGERQARRLQESIENFMVAVGLINCSAGRLMLDLEAKFREAREI
jgi:hypothetical protein